MKRLLLGTCFLLLIMAVQAQLQPVRLRCEFRVDPLGVDVQRPGLSWELKSGKKNVGQSAYRILVADAPGLLSKEQGNIWDSRK